MLGIFKDVPISFPGLLFRTAYVRTILPFRNLHGIYKNRDFGKRVESDEMPVSMAKVLNRSEHLFIFSNLESKIT